MSEPKPRIEQLLSETSARVQMSLHGQQGNRDTQKYLKRVEPIIKENLPKPDFTGEQIARLEEWLSSDPEGTKNALLTTYLDYSLQAYEASEQQVELTQTHFGVPGHDMENVVHTVTSVLGMIDSADGQLGDYATWELLVSGLNENLGRLMEGDDYNHQATGFLLARQAIKAHGGEDTDQWLKEEELKLISNRVLGNIYGHGGRNVGDPVSDLVRQSNRLQMCEPRFLRRSLEYDVAQVGQGIISPIDPERQTDMSITFRPGATSMDWGEFYARSLFPFEDGLNNPNPEVFKKIMHENQEVANDRRANSVAYLIILSGGEGTELYNQIFAPELGLVKKTHWSKKELPDEVFDEGRRKYQDFTENPPKFPSLEGLDDRQQIAKILRTVSSFVPDELLGKIYEKYDDLHEDEKLRLVNALHFSLMLHYQELEQEIELTVRLSESENPHVAKVARFANRYLTTKLF